MERPLDPKKEKQSKIALKRRVQSLQKKLKSKGIEYDVQVSYIFKNIIMEWPGWFCNIQNSSIFQKYFLLS